MALFSKLIEPAQVTDQHKSIRLVSPISGRVLPLDDVPCLAHQQRMFGEGVAIAPSGYQILAPFNCVIEEFPLTCERIRIRSKSGVRMQIQFGLDAERLMGEGFKAQNRQQKLIKKGQVLLEFDLPKLKQRLDCVLCPVTILNSDKLTGILPAYHQVIAMEDEMMSLII